MADSDITNKEMSNIIQTNLGQLILNEEINSRVHVLDRRYQPVELEWVLCRIRMDPILARHRYKHEVFDCDDYVFHLKTQVALFSDLQNDAYPRAVGCLLTRKHALSFCVMADRSLAIINTQATEVAAEQDKMKFLEFLREAEGAKKSEASVIELILI